MEKTESKPLSLREVTDELMHLEYGQRVIVEMDHVGNYHIKPAVTEERRA